MKVELFDPFGEWKDVSTGWETHRYRTLGRVKREEGVYHTIVQVDTMMNSIAQSLFRTQILVGNLVDSKILKEELATLDEEQPSLWCRNCFFEGPEMSGKGGVILPKHLKSRYFFRLEILPACMYCQKGFTCMLDNTYLSPSLPITFLFRVIKEPKVQATVEEALFLRGVVPYNGVRLYTTKFPLDLKQELIAAAFSPKRIGAVLDAYGIEGVEAL